MRTREENKKCRNLPRGQVVGSPTHGVSQWPRGQHTPNPNHHTRALRLSAFGSASARATGSPVGPLRTISSGGEVASFRPPIPVVDFGRRRPRQGRVPSPARRSLAQRARARGRRSAANGLDRCVQDSMLLRGNPKINICIYIYVIKIYAHSKDEPPRRAAAPLLAPPLHSTSASSSSSSPPFLPSSALSLLQLW